MPFGVQAVAIAAYLTGCCAVISLTPCATAPPTVPAAVCAPEEPLGSRTPAGIGPGGHPVTCLGSFPTTWRRTATSRPQASAMAANRAGWYSARMASARYTPDG